MIWAHSRPSVCAPSLSSDEWVVVGEIDGTGGQLEFIDVEPINPQQFYRVRIAD